MDYSSLSAAQLAIIQNPLDAKIFLEGPAGCGKTTVGVERMLYLMEQGVPGDSILLLVPQRTLATPYYQALRTPGVLAGGAVTVLTVGGLAQRMVDLFWPLIADEAGFAHPDQPPTFLTLETAQYYMAHLVRPLLDEGYFETVTIQRNRLYSQILDNLNKAAVVGYAHTEIEARLAQASVGEPSQGRVYADAQYCANRFREYCLANNLLDFSLQVEVFLKHLWPTPLCMEYLLETYCHILFDNLEEDTPVAHDLLTEWLPYSTSALLIFDHEAGYRLFLGADPESGYELKALCDQQLQLDTSLVNGPQMLAFEMQLRRAFTPPSHQHLVKEEAQIGPATLGLQFESQRFHPLMLEWVSDQITELVANQGISPGEIVVLAPFLSDALRFALSNRLEAHQIPVRSHRPSRSLREEPVTQCLLTLAMLAHPTWGFLPTKFDVAYAIVQAIGGMDLVRAQLLAEIVYRFQEGEPRLTSFEQIRTETQERITYRLGGRYDALRLWLDEYRQGPEAELDHFLGRLFGEVLSQPGFGLHADYSAGEVTANLIESVQKFRWVVGPALQQEGIPAGKEYLLMVQDGVIAAQYIRSWQLQPENAVLLAPAYTFLMSNRPVDYQFWLDIGSRGWFERVYQPLTHPYVLSRHWPRDRVWTDEDEHEAAQVSLQRLTLGLIRRCRRGIYLGMSEFNEQGYEQRGPLLYSLNRVLRQIQSDRIL